MVEAVENLNLNSLRVLLRARWTRNGLSADDAGLSSFHPQPSTITTCAQGTDGSSDTVVKFNMRMVDEGIAASPLQSYNHLQMYTFEMLKHIGQAAPPGPISYQRNGVDES